MLIIQGDDDRNVYFAQTVGLVSLLRARNVEYELLVLPDDVHDSLIWSRWIELLTRIGAVFEEAFRDVRVPTNNEQRTTATSAFRRGRPGAIWPS